jgi:hypothetical protein
LRCKRHEDYQILAYQKKIHFDDRERCGSINPAIKLAGFLLNWARAQIDLSPLIQGNVVVDYRFLSTLTMVAMQKVRPSASLTNNVPKQNNDFPFTLHRQHQPDRSFLSTHYYNQSLLCYPYLSTSNGDE